MSIGQRRGTWHRGWTWCKWYKCSEVDSWCPISCSIVVRTGLSIRCDGLFGVGSVVFFIPFLVIFPASHLPFAFSSSSSPSLLRHHLPFTVLFITFRDEYFGLTRRRLQMGTGSPFLHWHIIWRRVASRPDGRKRNRRARRRSSGTLGLLRGERRAGGLILYQPTSGYLLGLTVSSKILV